MEAKNWLLEHVQNYLYEREKENIFIPHLSRIEVIQFQRNILIKTIDGMVQTYDF